MIVCFFLYLFFIPHHATTALIFPAHLTLFPFYTLHYTTLHTMLYSILLLRWHYLLIDPTQCLHIIPYHTILSYHIIHVYIHIHTHTPTYIDFLVFVLSPSFLSTTQFISFIPISLSFVMYTETQYYWVVSNVYNCFALLYLYCV